MKEYFRKLSALPGPQFKKQLPRLLVETPVSHLLWIMYKRFSRETADESRKGDLMQKESEPAEFMKLFELAKRDMITSGESDGYYISSLSERHDLLAPPKDAFVPNGFVQA